MPLSYPTEIHALKWSVTMEKSETGYQTKTVITYVIAFHVEAILSWAN